MKTLHQLFTDLPFLHATDLPDVEIKGIAIDSRAVKPGYLFVAMQGGTTDGHNYIQKAIDNGAAAQATLDVSQAFPVGDLGEGHAEELIHAGKGFDVSLAAVSGHTGCEFFLG